MSFKVNADLVALFRGLVSTLKPYASAQEVDISFKSTIKIQYSHYLPKDLISEITTLLTEIISFTPQSYKVNVLFKKDESYENCFYLDIVNTGVSLYNITKISKSIKFKTTVEHLDKEGTRFKVYIPISSPYDNSERDAPQKLTTKRISPYYLEISKRLKSYFGNINELEASALKMGYRENVFLKKVNVIISSHIHDNNFNVKVLATSVALSRTQLFRKIKLLTKM